MLPELVEGILALVGTVSGRFDAEARELEEAEARMKELLRAEGEILRKLALIYLPELTPEALDEAEGQLRESFEGALREQEKRRAALQAELPEKEAAVAEARARVEEMQTADRGTESDVREAETRIEARLSADPEFMEASARHGVVMARRDELKARRARLLAVAGVERPAYENDPVFSYLRRRGFGDPEREPGFVSRVLDGWLARRINFERMSRNYRILKLGPHQIQAEVAKLTKEATELEKRLDVMEAVAAESEGLEAVLTAHSKTLRRLVEAKDLLAEAEARRDAVEAELHATELARGKDHQEAVRIYRNFLEQKRVGQLMRAAKETPDPTDDELVARLRHVRVEIETLQTRMDELSSAMGYASRQTNRLRELNRRVKQSFSARRSNFRNDDTHPFRLEAFLKEELGLQQFVDDLLGDHQPTPISVSAKDPELAGWFTELDGVIDVELGDGGRDKTLIMLDPEGRVVRRRITKRGSVVRAAKATHGRDERTKNKRKKKRS